MLRLVGVLLSFLFLGSHASILDFIRANGGLAHNSISAPQPLNSLVSTAAIAAGTELLKIPSTLAFTSRTNPQTQFHTLVLTLTGQAQLEPRISLVLSLLHAAKSPGDSKFKDWLASIPRPLDVPVMFTEEELSSLDKTDSAARVRAHVESVSLVWGQLVQAGIDKLGVTKDDFLFAFSVVSGWRTIFGTAKDSDGVEPSTELALLPGMTAAAHCNTPNAVLSAQVTGEVGAFFNQGGGDFVMLATKDLAPNAQICLDYGFSSQYEGFTAQGVVQPIDALDSITLVVDSPSQPMLDALSKLDITTLEFVLTPTSIPLKLLTYLRVKHGANTDNPDVVAMLNKGLALTLDNDHAAIKELYGALAQLASGWSTSLEADYQQLQSRELSRRQRLAIEFRLREKRVVLGGLSIAKDLWGLWILPPPPPTPASTNPKE